jgi:hypothetical protein
VRLDQILPSLSRFYALFVDRERSIHVHGVAAVKNGPTVTDERFGHPKGRERRKEHFQVVALILCGGDFAGQDGTGVTF